MALTGAASVTVFGRCTVALLEVVDGAHVAQAGSTHTRALTEFVMAVWLAGFSVMPWLLPP